MKIKKFLTIAQNLKDVSIILSYVQMSNLVYHSGKEESDEDTENKI
jgi:hypothetical protein